MEGITNFKVRRERGPDGSDHITVLLDGSYFTFEAEINNLVAFRLGQELIRVAKEKGLPDTMVDTETP